jgi:tRNA-binding protein
MGPGRGASSRRSTLVLQRRIERAGTERGRRRTLRGAGTRTKGPKVLVRYRAPMIEYDDFARIDMRVGRVIEAVPFPEARKPSYRLRVDFGPELGERVSSAQLTVTYPDPATLVGRQVVAVVNFPPRRIAGFASEVLLLGAMGSDGQVQLLAPDPPAAEGLRIG